MSDQPPSDSRDNSRPRLRFFPKNWNDGTLIYACIILASVTGLIVMGLSLYKSNQTQKQEIVEAEIHKDWVENLIPTQADLIDALLQDVNQSRTLVVFEFGTVVIVPEPSKDPKYYATVTLKKNATGNSLFAVSRVDKDYAVRFKGPVFTRISGDAVADEFKRINKNWKEYLTPAELAKHEKDGTNPDLSTQVGLVARSFLARDLENLKVTKILKASSK